MIGRFSSANEVTVIGGGIAGLLLARQLDLAGREVTLIEAADRCGGLIESTQVEQGLVEHAAHSILATPPVIKLCEELNVELVATNEDAKARFILRDGTIRPAMRVLTPGEWFGVIRRILFVKGVGEDRSQSMSDWAARHLGEPARDYMLAPFLLGIYGTYGHETGVKAAFPDMAVHEGRNLMSVMRERKRKKKAGRAVMMAPRNGMQSLVDALASRLAGSLEERFITGREVTSLPENGDVAICTPAAVAARLLEPVCPESSAALASIRYVPLISVTCFMRKEDCANIPKGIGVLVPPKENHGMLGVLFPSMFFENRAHDDYVALAFMLGGSLRPELIDDADEALEVVIAEELQSVFGIDAKPVSMKVSRYRDAIPVHAPDGDGAGLLEAHELVLKNWCSEPGHVLFGNYTGQVSVRGMIETCDRAFA